MHNLEILKYIKKELFRQIFAIMQLFRHSNLVMTRHLKDYTNPSVEIVPNFIVLTVWLKE
jgi:hypothetical protein